MIGAPQLFTGRLLDAEPWLLGGRDLFLVSGVRNPLLGDRKLTDGPVTGRMTHECASLPAAFRVWCVFKHTPGCLVGKQQKICPGSFVRGFLLFYAIVTSTAINVLRLAL